MTKLKFHDHVDQLKNKFDELIQFPLVSATEATSSKTFPAKPGIYVFYEGDKPLYVGRSNNMKNRVRIHRMSDHMGSNFAFKLAKERAFEVRLDLKGTKNKKEKMNIPEFKEMFVQAKIRISGMSVRTVEIQEPIMQLLFEAYTHLELDTPYNDFDNH